MTSPTAPTMSHELRLSSPTDWRMRFVGGLFYEDREVQANTDWLYKSVPECPAGVASTSDCFLLPRSTGPAEVCSRQP